ncbi:MAG: hypothetical protein II621_02395, partial [Clostridia bacterium]|nr:hypothetical protein [Clostridia bacterium]
MFYAIESQIREVERDALDPNVLTAGYISADELEELGPQYGFARSTVAACRRANQNFRSGVEVYDHYTFTELRVIDSGNFDAKPDCVALYIMKNLLLVVDVDDRDGSTKQKFFTALRRYAPHLCNMEKLIFAFLDLLVSRDMLFIENTGNAITALEESVFHDEADDSFNVSVLQMKKHLLSMHNYYDQILDITDAIEENENDLFAEDDLMYIANLSQKVTRLREDVDSLQNAVEHLQDAYSAALGMKLNRTMKVLTVITTVFFPLTIIVGWYGMNFVHMPEFRWRYGYVYVIALSVTV